MNMTRRDALAGAAIVAASTATRTAHGAWEPNERYPDPAVKISRPQLPEISAQHRGHGAPSRRHALERRPDLVW